MSSDDRESSIPDHDPEVGDWYYSVEAQEICCVIRIGSWSQVVDDEMGLMAELLFEDGVLWDAPVSALRDDPHWLPLDRPDDLVSPAVMDEAIEAIESSSHDIEATLMELAKEVDLGEHWTFKDGELDNY